MENPSLSRHSLSTKPHLRTTSRRSPRNAPNKRELEELVNECSSKLDIDPACLRTRAIRGHACMKVEKWDIAATDFTEILQVRQDDLHGLYSRGMAFFKGGKIELAIKDFNRVLHAEPNHAMARYARAGCFNIAGEFNQAIEDYTIALNCDSREQTRGTNRLYFHSSAEKVINNKLLARDPRPEMEFNPPLEMQALRPEIETKEYVDWEAIRPETKTKHPPIKRPEQKPERQQRRESNKSQAHARIKRCPKTKKSVKTNTFSPAIVKLNLSDVLKEPRKTPSTVKKKTTPIKRVTISL